MGLNLNALRHQLPNNYANYVEKENQMKCNVGNTDRIIRVIIGAGIIAAGVYFQSWWGAIGVVPIVTAAIGWCPAYSLFGISGSK
ncbi:MAG TPA: DUF2892 domain-containing protein [Methylophilaceae bacterium]|nr:DUF2892 domain-containing protein [Methylophilaceae bacterium]